MDKIISEIKKIGAKYNFEKIVLFGSRARGDNTAKSDIDLVVFAKNRNDEANFIFELEDIDTLLKFDVIFVIDDMEDKFLKNIKKDGVIIMDRYSTKLENFANATDRLKEAIAEYQGNNSKTVRDGVIQRFEFCVELAWKTLREYLIDQGFTRTDSPKSIMKEAFMHNIINEDKVWIDMLNDRNLTSHLYKDETAQEIFENIVGKYADELEKLVNLLKA